jgi:predicted phosphodiesterase
MKYSPWTEEEARLAKAQTDKRYTDISNILKAFGYDRSPSAVRHFLNREKDSSSWKQFCNATLYDPEDVAFTPMPLEVKAPCASSCVSHGNDFDDTLSAIEAEREKTFQMNEELFGHIGNPQGKLFKVVSISDFHLPFIHEGVLQHMLENHNDSDILVINGDILDQYSVSKWPKSKAVLLRHEYQMAVKYLKLLSNNFKKVVLTRGNHDDRVAKYFSANIDPAISFLTHPDPLERMVKGYDFSEDGDFVKINDFSNIYYAGGLCAWWVKVGKTIFVHPSGGSGVPMRTAVNAANHFMEREDFDCIVCAHTHQQGQVIYKGKLLIEQGCACIPMDYEASARMQYNQQSFGYAIVYMTAEGRVDYEMSRPLYYGSGSCADTDVRLDVRSFE